MATPSLTYAASRTTVSGTTFTPTLPSGTGRVFVPVSCPSNTVLSTTSTDWRVYRAETNSTTLGCTWFVSKVSAGSSPGALVVTSAASTLFSTVAVRSDILRTRFVFGTPVSGTAANANPGQIDLLKSQAARFVEVLTLNGTGVASAASSGYSSLTTQAGFTAGASTCVADRSATSQTEDPGTWTHSSAAYITQTIALVDAGTAWNDDWTPAVRNLTTNAVNVAVNFWGDSLTTGATAASGGMAANQIATARPALFAANLKGGRTSNKTWQGVGGGNVTSGQLASYDSRRSPGAAWDTSRNSGVNSLGGGALTGPTSGQVLAFTPGGSWDRHRVLFAQYSGSPQYTTRVDAGSTTTLLMNQVTGAITWSPAVTGSGTTINIASTGASGYILATEAYTNGTPQISVFNCGWFGSTSTQNAEVANFYSPPFVAAALAAKLTVICIGSNDPGLGVTTQQTIANTQIMALVGLITGSVVIETPPYASGGTEAAQDVSFDVIESIADAMCTGFLRISTKTGWTSYATASASGFMTAGDNHCSTAGYASWSGFEIAYMDPGAAIVAPGLLSSTNTFPAPTVAPGPVTLTPALFTNSNSFPAATVTPGPVTLTPSLFSNSNTFPAPVVGTFTTLSPSLFTDTNTFYAPSVAFRLSAPLVFDPGTIYSPTVTSAGVSLLPPLVSSTNAFYAPTVVAVPVVLTPPLVSSSNSFFAPTVSQGSNVQPLTPALFTNTNTFFGPTITTGGVTLTASLLVNVNTFYPASFSPSPTTLICERFDNVSFVFLPTASNDNAPLSPGTYPLSIEEGGSVVTVRLAGGGSVVIDSIASGVTVIPSALRGRP